MKNFAVLILSLALSSVSACTPEKIAEGPATEDAIVFSRAELARIFSELPLGEEQLHEVYDAVCSSSGNGYDEEYLMADLLDCPGKGVGEKKSGTKAASYSSPIKDILSSYLIERAGTKGGISDAEAYLKALSESDLQIYWPYSENWNGEFPIITFDPGYGAESNVGYKVKRDASGFRVVDSLTVTEEIAMTSPVWVINSNDDSAYTPFDMYTKAGNSSSKGSEKKLYLKDITALRNYDSWFGGASEFLIKLGAVDGFKASTDEELKLYTPSVTDFMIVIKRKDIGKTIPYQCLMLSDFTEQMEKLAFLIIEDDGGTSTSWKCSATVKYKSKSFGFEIEIPYRDKDDIVWRGRLDASYFNREGETEGRFGDVLVTFEME